MEVKTTTGIQDASIEATFQIPTTDDGTVDESGNIFCLFELTAPQDSMLDETPREVKIIQQTHTESDMTTVTSANSENEYNFENEQNEHITDKAVVDGGEIRAVQKEKTEYGIDNDITIETDGQQTVVSHSFIATENTKRTSITFSYKGEYATLRCPATYSLNCFLKVRNRLETDRDSFTGAEMMSLLKEHYPYKNDLTIISRWKDDTFTVMETMDYLHSLEKIRAYKDSYRFHFGIKVEDICQTLLPVEGLYKRFNPDHRKTQQDGIEAYLDQDNQEKISLNGLLVYGAFTRRSEEEITTEWVRCYEALFDDNISTLFTKHGRALYWALQYAAGIREYEDIHWEIPDGEIVETTNKNYHEKKKKALKTRSASSPEQIWADITHYIFTTHNTIERKEVLAHLFYNSGTLFQYKQWFMPSAESYTIAGGLSTDNAQIQRATTRAHYSKGMIAINKCNFSLADTELQKCLDTAKNSNRTDSKMVLQGSYYLAMVMNKRFRDSEVDLQEAILEANTIKENIKTLSERHEPELTKRLQYIDATRAEYSAHLLMNNDSATEAQIKDRLTEAYNLFKQQNRDADQEHISRLLNRLTSPSHNTGREETQSSAGS